MPKILRTSVKSALNQTYENFEIIFFNNNSKYNTKKIIKNLKIIELNTLRLINT